ncbi:MAG TPA: hypothetical protein VJ965_07840 [Anaerolineales bacterium]|nr:hypothetical protein [Anaerolineales bacterium]
MSKSILSIVNILSILISLFFFSSTPTSMGTGETGSLIFRSRLTGWEWHLGQIEITFLDSLWIITALIILIAVLVFSTRNVHRTPIFVGICAAVLIAAQIDFWFLLTGTSLNIFIQTASWFGPALVKLFIG